MKQINFSIIIPHKNIPHLLARCLKSIPKREDIQIIVVDDNSDIVEVQGVNLQTLSKNNPKIDFLFGKNEDGRKGAGYARNLGLNKAVGKWVLFADADDYFNENIIEAFDNFADNPNDIVIFRVTAERNPNYPNVNREEDWNNMWDLLNSTKKKEYAMYFAGPIAKFVRLDLIKDNNITFQEVMHSNDVMFSARIGSIAKSVETSVLPIYCITVREGSLTNKDTIASLKTRFDVSCDFYLYRKSLGFSDGKINPDYLFRMKNVSFMWFYLLSIKYIRICGLKKYLTNFSWYKELKAELKDKMK